LPLNLVAGPEGMCSGSDILASSCLFPELEAIFSSKLLTEISSLFPNLLLLLCFSSNLLPGLDELLSFPSSLLSDLDVDVSSC